MIISFYFSTVPDDSINIFKFIIPELYYLNAIENNPKQ